MLSPTERHIAESSGLMQAAITSAIWDLRNYPAHSRERIADYLQSILDRIKATDPWKESAR